jgi:hypothetical protein
MSGVLAGNKSLDTLIFAEVASRDGDRDIAEKD